MERAHRTPRTQWLLGTTAFLSGAGVLVVELAATRALAPFFGQALFVWTNVIGLVLLGLALGALVGGRWADRSPEPKSMALVLLAASLAVAVSAFTPPLVSRWILPEDLPLEASYDFLAWGSFVATLVCFVPPVFLLGALPPFLVRCAASSITDVGRTAGRIYFASSIGSILGTFATTHLLLPRLGTRGSLLLAAALLAASSLPVLLTLRSRFQALLGLLLVGGTLGALSSERVRAAPAGAAHGELIAAQDSAYQHLEIRRWPELDDALVLALDEGHDSFQSILPAKGVLTGGYYDAFPVLCHQAEVAGALRVLILGFAGGTHARILLHYFDALEDLKIVGVELDPAVVAIARDHLGLPSDPRLEIVTGVDGRIFLEHCDEHFDVICVDCYSHQSFLPFHLATKEMFEAAHRRLRPGGWIALNLSGYGGADPVIRAVSQTLASAFGGAASCWLPQSINVLAYSRKDADVPLPREFRRAGLHEDLLPILEGMTQRAWWNEVGPDDTTLHDDRSNLDWIQAVRLRARADRVLREADS